MKKLPKWALILLTPVMTACPSAGVGTNGREIPANASEQCHSDCAELGMELTGMVSMAGDVGCVCQPRGSAASKPSYVAAFGGSVAIAKQEAAARESTKGRRQRK